MKNVFILSIVFVIVSCSGGQKNKIEKYINADLKSKLSDIEIKGVKIDQYEDSSRNIYLKLIEYEKKCWEWRAEKSIDPILVETDLGKRMKFEADSIYKIIQNYLKLAENSNKDDIFYYTHVYVVKEDTTVNKMYYFDKDINLISKYNR